MTEFDLKFIADIAGGWMARTFWEDAREALRTGRILPPKFMLAAANEGDREAARACVEWVWHAQKIEYSKESMRLLVEDERDRLRAIAKRKKEIARMKAREEREARAQA